MNMSVGTGAPPKMENFCGESPNALDPHHPTRVVGGTDNCSVGSLVVLREMMDHRTLGRVVLLLTLALAVVALPGSTGCSHRKDRDHKLETQKTPLPGLSPNQTEDSRIVQATVSTLATTFDKLPPNPVNKKPLHALLLSGGGQYAAFNAGLLLGWTASGQRPSFDAVTGVSSGAIVGLYAFLGPKYDPRLQYFFTTLQDKDIFRYRPIYELVTNGALADPQRMKKLFDSEINDCMLMDIREAHNEGRRFFVATMNLKTRRPCIWDLGAIACSGRPDAGDLVRKIMLASSAIPGLLPSVKFDYDVDGQRFREEHVDGGASTQTFLRLGPGALQPDNGQPLWLKGSNLYSMAAGKLYPPLLKDDPGFIRRITSTVSAALYALFRAESMGLYAFCTASGMKFHMLAIPEDAEVPANSTTFDPKAMKKLSALGYDMAKETIPWRLTPPGAEPGEEEPTRDATDLLPAKKK